MKNLITDYLDIWTTAHKTRSTAGRGSNNKLNLHGIKKLRELILELAVRGKLVPQDANDEPASELLKKIAAEKARLVKEGKIKKEKPLPPISEDEKPFELPRGWEWARLGEITEANTGFAFKSSEYKEFGVLVLRVTNINSDGTINLEDNKYIDSSAAQTIYKKYELFDGDIILVMVGGSLGKIGIVTKKALPAVLNQNMWKLDRSKQIEPKYFIAGLRYINKHLITITKSTHGHLAQGMYLEKPFPLPPLAEQHRIVAKVDELMILCDTLKTNLQNAQNTQLQLADALVEQAVN